MPALKRLQLSGPVPVHSFLYGALALVAATVMATGCAHSNDGRNKWGSNLGRPVEVKPGFGTLTSRPEELTSMPLTYKVGGVSIASKNWIFAHAVSRLVYELTPGQFSTLSFEMGLDDVTGPDPGSVVYVVKGDGRELYRSPVIKAMTPPVPASADIRGVKQLELTIENGGDTIVSDEAYWIDLKAR